MTRSTILSDELADSDPVTADLMFQRASAGLPCWVGSSKGARRELPTDRWMGGDVSTAADRLADAAMLTSCIGPTLDLGCGPGRLTAELVSRGVTALGVDTSATAVELTINRGGKALNRDIFAPLPASGHWAHILLADGNIGIGGDPVRLLQRASDLLAPHGVIIAEVDPPNTRGVHYEVLRWETDTLVGDWFAWASVGADAATELAEAAGLHVRNTVEMSGRYFVQIGRGGSAAL